MSDQPFEWTDWMNLPGSIIERARVYRSDEFEKSHGSVWNSWCDGYRNKGHFQGIEVKSIQTKHVEVRLCKDCLQAINGNPGKQKLCYFCGKMAPVTFDAEQVFDDWSTKNEIICDWRSRFDGIRERLKWASLDETNKGCHPKCALEYALKEEGFT